MVNLLAAIGLIWLAITITGNILLPVLDEIEEEIQKVDRGFPSELPEKERKEKEKENRKTWIIVGIFLLASLSFLAFAMHTVQ